jgi:RNA polymerase sigma factor (sigma-70 family)
MAQANTAVYQELAELFSHGACTGHGDGLLLERFARRRDEWAFAALVKRHGPMVLGVCRRVLVNHHDAEDAFQATFLVLARKADSVRVRETLGPWLHGVANRIALRSRARTARLRDIETQASTMRPATSAGNQTEVDLVSAVHEELDRLPARYRDPVLVCDLSGLGRRDAADRLGLPEGTVSSRLARGRALLKERLRRRGFGLAAGSVAALLAESARATVSQGLVDTTTVAATRFAAGSVATGAISASVASLTQGALNAMAWTKVKVMAAVIVIGLTVTVWAQAQSGSRGPENTERSDPRFRDVERKLDRILEALERSNRPAGDQPVFPREERRNLGVDVFSREVGKTAAAPRENGPFNREHADHANVQERLTRVERTLAEVVERLNRLESPADKSAPRAKTE